MNGFKLFFLILTFVSFSSVAQQLPERENDTLIVWTEDRKLQWSDFNPLELEGNKAATSDIGIDILTVSSSKGGFEHEVFSYFLKRSSSTATDDAGVLNHEQVHFDIAELYARKIRQKLHQIRDRGYTIKEYHSIVDKIYQDYFEVQNQYDKETGHSVNSEKQAEWDLWVARELKALQHMKSDLYR
jgi:hypothetical protein